MRILPANRLITLAISTCFPIIFDAPPLMAQLEITEAGELLCNNSAEKEVPFHPTPRCDMSKIKEMNNDTPSDFVKDFNRLKPCDDPTLGVLHNVPELGWTNKVRTQQDVQNNLGALKQATLYFANLDCEMVEYAASAHSIFDGLRTLKNVEYMSLSSSWPEALQSHFFYQIKARIPFPPFLAKYAADLSRELTEHPDEQELLLQFVQPLDPTHPSSGDITYGPYMQRYIRAANSILHAAGFLQPNPTQHGSENDPIQLRPPIKSADDVQKIALSVQPRFYQALQNIDSALADISFFTATQIFGAYRPVIGALDEISKNQAASSKALQPHISGGNQRVSDQLNAGSIVFDNGR